MSLFPRTALFSARSGKLDGVSFPFPSLRVRPPLSAPTQHSVCSLMRTKKDWGGRGRRGRGRALARFPPNHENKKRKEEKSSLSTSVRGPNEFFPPCPRIGWDWRTVANAAGATRIHNGNRQTFPSTTKKRNLRRSATVGSGDY